MSSSLQNETLIPETGDRRLFSRKKLPQVVLVFFARNGWGRLVNISEDGMAFEFSGLSDTGQLISFELVDLTQNSIQVDGRIIWTRDLDKIAGMQFVDLIPESKQQIKQWLSAGKFTQTRVHDETQRRASQTRAREETKPSVEIQQPDAFTPPEEFKPATEFKPLEPPPKPDKAPTRSRVVEPQPEERNPRGLTSLVPEPRPEKEPTRSRVLKHRPPPQPEERVPRGLTSLVSEPRPAPRPEAQPEPQPELRPEPLVTRDPNLEVWDDYFNRAHVGLDKQPLAWTTIVATLLGIAIFSALALLAGIWAARYRQSRADQAQENSRKAPNSDASANSSAGPFEVEVVDAKNKHWLLTFAGSSDKRAVAPGPRAVSGNSTFPATSARQSQNVASKNAQDAPAKSFAPPGQIEPARLISSVSPAYPAVARSQNIAGDVVIDALVDPTGRVTDMNVVSGPILLRQPAMESVRMSKYSPARLDGRPVSTHLLVTVRYAQQ
jgi:Gram-negative bacterial TonB protein C-terminal/PilZ domain